jgi:hypothetical protein
MEETQVGVDHDDAVLVASVNHTLVVVAACRGSNKLHAALVGSVNVVTERKECIGAQSHLFQGAKPLFSLILSKHIILHMEAMKWSHCIPWQGEQGEFLQTGLPSQQGRDRQCH